LERSLFKVAGPSRFRISLAVLRSAHPGDSREMMAADATGTTSAAGSEQPTELRPTRAALARMAGALRGVIAVVAVTSALVGGGSDVSWWWLIPALAAVACWTAVYVVVAWTRGLRFWLIGADLLLTAALCLALGKLVPAGAVSGTTSWVTNIASMAVVCAQLAGMTFLSVPAGLLVAVSAVVGARLAHSSDGGVPAATVLATQTVIAAAVMVVALRTERSAVGSFIDLQETEAAAGLASAEREDERAQLRQVHNGPLTTLTMALHASPERLGEVLRRHAATTLDSLPQLAAETGAGNREVRLDEHLAHVVASYEPLLSITTNLQACPVPADIAEAFAGAVREALENVIRYAGTRHTTAELRDDAGVIRVTVADRGRGFDTTQLSSQGFGLREDLIGRMAAIGGSATVRSSPGKGTTVDLVWRRV
jgi:signal transduction histidine kinase